MIRATEDDYMIKAGELEPGEKLWIGNLTVRAYDRDFQKSAQAALDAQYGKERRLLAYWHGGFYIYRDRS